MAARTKHPKELTDAEVDALVARADAAVDSGSADLIAGDVVIELQRAAEERQAAEVRVEDAVRAGRAAGLSWGVIGAQLGISRQGARQRFERILDR